MKRREFLKKAAIGTAGLASFPILGSSLVRSVQAAGQTNFHFVALSQGANVANVKHAMSMNGEGRIFDGGVQGGGAYVHYDDATSAPKSLLSTGKWEATSLLNTNWVGTYGVFVAGVVEMEANLLQEAPSAAVIPATVKVVCNLSVGALFNPNPNPPPANLPEGYTVKIPDVGYGPFVPFQPPIGITVFTTGKRVEDEALENATEQLQTTRTLYLPTAVLIPSAVAGAIAVAWARGKRKGK